MTAIAARATGGVPVDEVSGGSAGSFHRRAYVEPPLQHESADGLADTAAVLVELGQSGGPNPSSVHVVESLLTRALRDFGANVAIGDWEDLAPFEVTILHPGRTLIEKLLRVNNFATRTAAQDDIHGWPRIGRQFYDIWALLGHDDVRALLADKQTVADIITSVVEVSAKFKPDEPIPQGGFANSAAFALDGDLTPGLRREHDRAMTNLYYGDPALAPSFDDVIGRVQDSAALLDL